MQRLSALGIPMIPQRMREQAFGDPFEPDAKKTLAAIELLKEHKLYGLPADEYKDLDFDLPPLLADDIEGHFAELGRQMSQPYFNEAEALRLATLPPIPQKWDLSAFGGWTRYSVDGYDNYDQPRFKVESVPYPLENALVFDIENPVLYSRYSCLAVAVSSQAWYLWLSPFLNRGSEQLIPMGQGKVIVAHNSSYDAARVREQYNLEGSTNRFMDTMSLHMCVNGLSGNQRTYMQKFKKDNESVPARAWLDHGSMNSLKDVYELHCGGKLDKTSRDLFVTGTMDEIRANLHELVSYCSRDVKATHEVFKVVFGKYQRHMDPKFGMLSFTGMLEMSTGYLPLTDGWFDYVQRSNNVYNQKTKELEDKLMALAKAALANKDYASDPWLKNLDWTPGASGERKGLPLWWRKVLDSTSGAPTTRTNVTPYLLRLQWLGYPLYYHEWGEDESGNTATAIEVTRNVEYLGDVPFWDTLTDEVQKAATRWQRYEKSQGTDKPIKEPPAKIRKLYHQYLDAYEDAKPNIKKVAVGTGKWVLPGGFKNVGSWGYIADEEHEGVGQSMPTEHGTWWRIPHKDGDSARCGSPLAKDYLSSIEDGSLSSDLPVAAQALDTAASCSYWTSVKSRINDQFIMRDPYHGNLCVIPQMVVAGTTTRRAVERTWLTASNSKKNRIGSELKSRVQAPPGWRIVGADVDSEELWLAAMEGDAKFEQAGATPLSMQTLMGKKETGSDMHSRTATTLGIKRDDAKIINYSRLYGAGLKATAAYLKQFNKRLTEGECKSRAEALFQQTKGKKVYVDRGSNARLKHTWVGGSESHTFNALESIATSSLPRTSVLGFLITEALQPANCGKDFMTSRVNWCVQSSGVDYMHLTFAAVNYLLRYFDIAARPCIPIHDEFRFLVREEFALQFAFLMQIAHIWVRAFISSRFGIRDLPIACAFHSAVDIDNCLRKDPVGETCITPSNPVAVPPGEALDIWTIVERLRAGEGLPVAPVRKLALSGKT